MSRNSRNNLPKISIVVPSYNQGQYIERTILSVLCQDYPNKELIVADGASTDNTLDILKRYPDVIWFSEPDRGYADAVNKGLDRATGEIIGIQSSDDYYNQGAFKRIIRIFINNSGCGMVCGGHVDINDALNQLTPIVVPSPVSLRRFLRKDTTIFQDATFFRREVLEKIRPLNPDFDLVADFDLWIRILSYYEADVIDFPISFYLHHSNQRTEILRGEFPEQSIKMIRSWMSSPHFPEELRLNPSEIEATIAIRQALLLNTQGMVSAAHKKLSEAVAIFPKCKEWNFYKKVCTECDFKDSTPSKRHYNLTGFLGFIRSYLVRYKWKYINRRRALLQRALDPAWIYHKSNKFKK